LDKNNVIKQVSGMTGYVNVSVNIVQYSAQFAGLFLAVNLK